MDYGNTDSIDSEEIMKMPEKLIAIEPQARKCELAYLRMPQQKHGLEDEVAQIMESFIEKTFEAKFVYKSHDTYYVIWLIQAVVKVDGKSLNEQLLAKGHAKIDKAVKLPDEYKNWLPIEEKAMDKKYGMWKYDDDEEDY